MKHIDRMNLRRLSGHVVTWRDGGGGRLLKKYLPFSQGLKIPLGELSCVAH